MTTVAVTGYASLDHVVRIEGAPKPNKTVIAARGVGGWPRLGGSPSYVAMALTRAGVRAMPVTWVADDEAGCEFVAALRAEGVPVDGVACTLAGHTPICILAYGPDDACFCLYDPGASRISGLADAQRAIVAAADWVCVTVGPAEAARAVVAQLQQGQKLAWVVKADGDAFPPELRATLAARADLIVHSGSERPFVSYALRTTPARAHRILVETRGAEGAEVTVEGQARLIEASGMVAAPDPTGAGDTFVGGLLAALIGSPGDAAAAVRAGQDAAHRMLLMRRQGKSA